MKPAVRRGQRRAATQQKYNISAPAHCTIICFGTRKGNKNVDSYREIQTGDMKRRPGNGIEGVMVCTSLGTLLRPLFYFLDDVSYPQSVELGRLFT